MIRRDNPQIDRMEIFTTIRNDQIAIKKNAFAVFFAKNFRQIVTGKIPELFLVAVSR